jgi:hypothetical protein
MTSTILLPQEASTQERVSEFLSAASVVLSSISLLLVVAIAF